MIQLGFITMLFLWLRGRQNLIRMKLIKGRRLGRFRL